MFYCKGGVPRCDCTICTVRCGLHVLKDCGQFQGVTSPAVQFVNRLPHNVNNASEPGSSTTDNAKEMENARNLFLCDSLLHKGGHLRSKTDKHGILVGGVGKITTFL